MMGAGYVQVRCPACNVDQPAKLAIVVDTSDDFTRPTVAATMSVDMRSVNAHVEACRKRNP